MSDQPKTKEKATRQRMPEQAAEIRRRNFEEVPMGYTPEMAIAEAGRCLQCKKPGCVEGCPVSIDIPGFIKLIAEEKFTEAIRHIWSQNALPAVCGRVCPQENQCEGQCILKKKGDAVAIGNLERFAADWERANGTGALPPVQPPTGKRIAVVGSGPSGLTVAGWKPFIRLEAFWYMEFRNFVCRKLLLLKKSTFWRDWALKWNAMR
jgi:glutamate synthase (NADPH) small chain